MQLDYFFYLEKAYDTTWKGGIMKDLHEIGLKGKLPLFIDIFLMGRKFKVRFDNTHSSQIHRRRVSHKVVFFHQHYLPLK